MTTTFTCPACGATYHMPDESIGRKARCKQCGHVFRLEASVAEVVPPPVVGGRSAGDTDLQQVSRDTAGPVVAKATGNGLSRIRHFEVRRKLRLVAFGAVDLAHDLTMDREVAERLQRPHLAGARVVELVDVGETTRSKHGRRERRPDRLPRTQFRIAHTLWPSFWTALS